MVPLSVKISDEGIEVGAWSKYITALVHHAGGSVARRRNSPASTTGAY